MSKYIGDVSAYAYAVSKGYTGTEEEFAELMADYADVGQRAEDAADSALNSKTAAQTAAQTATTKASEASTSATSASGSASAASASASAASGSATSAANSATAASGSATSAAGSATTASTKASEASASATAAQTAQTAAEAAQTAAETAQGKAEDAKGEAETTAQSIAASAAQIATNAADIAELQSEVSQKAYVDGAYSDLTAGNAEQLVSTVYEEDSVPYIFRTAGGSMDIGDREEDMLVGGTVCWNQIAKELIEGNYNKGDGTAVYDNGTVSFTAASQYGALYGSTLNPLVNGHKYLINSDIKLTNVTEVNRVRVALGYTGYNQGAIYVPSASPINTFINVSGVVQYNPGTNPTNNYLFLQDNRAETSQIDIKNLMLIDLTQMFSSTIADYIYSLEQSTAGAGVAFFRKMFPKDYYPYDAGTLKSVEGVSSHDMVGFNQWDEEWQSYSTSQIKAAHRIPVIAGATYYAKSGAQGLSLYFFESADGSSVASGVYNNSTFTVPKNCHYMMLYTNTGYGTTYKNDICINLSWDGERDGEYEPYVKRSYPLDSSLTLRGIPKLDSANNLYYDGDTYESDGTVTRRFETITLNGSEAWNMDSSQTDSSGNQTSRFYMTNNAIKKPDGTHSTRNYIGHMLSTIPTVKGGYVNQYSMNGIDIAITGYQGDGSNYLYIIVNNAINSTLTSVDALKSWLVNSPLTVLYELATPTTETADPYQNPQIVDDFGTEEYVTTSIVPVGHVTKYQPNLRAKLEMSPDSPDGDGDYIVRQSNGENSYVSLASTATIQDILARLTALEGNTNEG